MSLAATGFELVAAGRAIAASGPSHAGLHTSAAAGGNASAGKAAPTANLQLARCGPQTGAVSAQPKTRTQLQKSCPTPLTQHQGAVRPSERSKAGASTKRHHRATAPNRNKSGSQRNRSSTTTEPRDPNLTPTKKSGSANHPKAKTPTPRKPPAAPKVKTPTPPKPPAAQSTDEAETNTGATPTATAITSIWSANPAVSAAITQLSSALANNNSPPSALIPIYKAAGRRYNVPWQVLAAINAVETSYGNNLNVSSAGAVGWMQFMPATWLQYGISASGIGAPDPYNPSDAIFSAARYLAANGAADNLPQAIYAYNHATWYVQEVLSIAERINANGLHPSSSVKTKLAAMNATAKLLNGLPYLWGGGHASWTISAGYDCSGFVSALLHAAGYLTAPVTTQTLPSQPGIRTGPGKWVTIFDRTNASATTDHTIIEIDGQWWESGGSATAGVHRINAVSASYLTTFNVVLHPDGL